MYKLESFNNYRQRLGFKKYASFQELTDDTEMQHILKDIYGNIDNVDQCILIFCILSNNKFEIT